MQPCASGISLSQMNNKSSVLCPETQDITSQYLALQQLDAHQKMVSRAKGCVDSSAPKSMQSYLSVSNQKKKKMLKNLKSESTSTFLSDQPNECNRPSSSRLNTCNSEDGIESTNTSFVNKAIQAGIPVSSLTCKTAEKISWYLEALSLGELHSQYFTFMDNYSGSSKLIQLNNLTKPERKRRVVKGDIIDHHKSHFKVPRKPFSPRILADQLVESKVKNMDCYNPPFRKKKSSSVHSYDTFESYEEDDEAEFSEQNGNIDTSDHSSVEEETLINRKPPPETTASRYNFTPPSLPQYRRNCIYSNSSDILNENEEEKYLDFLSKVTEDILRSGVYSDKAIQQAFEFHMQFYKDESSKDKLQSLLEQVLHGLKISHDDENLEQRRHFLFSQSRPNTPPEKETSGVLSQNGTLKTASEYNLAEVNESVDHFVNS